MAISAEKREYYEKLFPRAEMIVGASSGDQPISQEEYDEWLEIQPEPAVHQARENQAINDCMQNRSTHYPCNEEQVHAIMKGLAVLKAAGTDLGEECNAMIDRIAAVKAKFPKPEGSENYVIDDTPSAADGSVNTPDLPE